MEIYVVTSGCYSDYGIEAVFIDKAKAEEFVNVRNDFEYSDYRIETYNTDECKQFSEEKVEFAYIPKTKECLPRMQYINRYKISYVYILPGWKSKGHEVQMLTDVSFCSFKDIAKKFEGYYFDKNKLNIKRMIEEDLIDGVYFVDVKFNPDYDVMRKSVFDKIAFFKDYTKDFPEGWDKVEIKKEHKF